MVSKGSCRNQFSFYDKTKNANFFLSLSAGIAHDDYFSYSGLFNCKFYNYIFYKSFNNKLRVLSSEHDWFAEYRNLHREGGLVVKEDDDIMSATRILCMGIHRARTLERSAIGQPDYYVRPHGAFSAAPSRQGIAKGTHFDVFNPGNDFDLFGGR